jgi:hypothetical protein
MSDEQEKSSLLQLARNGYIRSACSHGLCVGTHSPEGPILYRSFDRHYRVLRADILLTSAQRQIPSNDKSGTNRLHGVFAESIREILQCQPTNKGISSLQFLKITLLRQETVVFKLNKTPLKPSGVRNKYRFT